MATRRPNTRRSAIVAGSPGTPPPNTRRHSQDLNFCEVPLFTRPPTPRNFNPIQTLSSEFEGLHLNRNQDFPKPSPFDTRRSIQSKTFYGRNNAIEEQPTRSRTTYPNSELGQVQRPGQGPGHSEIRRSARLPNLPVKYSEGFANAKDSEFPPLSSLGARRGRHSTRSFVSTASTIPPRIPQTTLDTFAGLLRTYPWGVSIPKYLFELREFVGGGRIKRGSVVSLTSSEAIAASMTSNLWDPDGNNYGYESFDDLVQDYPEIFIPLPSALGELLIFPANKRNLLSELGIKTDALPLFKYIWNMVKTILRENDGIMELSKISGRLTSLFGESVDPTNYVLSRELKYYFYYWCYKKMDNLQEIFVEWSLPKQGQAQVQPEVPPISQSLGHGGGRGRIQLRLQEDLAERQRASEKERVELRKSEFSGQSREDQVQVLVEVNPNCPLTLEYKRLRDARHQSRRIRLGLEVVQPPPINGKNYDFRLDTGKGRLGHRGRLKGRGAEFY